jgi:hypothetical protein
MAPSTSCASADRPLPRALPALPPLPATSASQGATRGSNQLFVSRSEPFSPGQWVRLVLDSPPTGGLVTDLMSGMITEDPVYRNRSGMLSFISRVAVVGSGWVRLERALPYNVSMRYNPSLHDFNLGEGGGGDGGGLRGVQPVCSRVCVCLQSCCGCLLLTTPPSMTANWVRGGVTGVACGVCSLVVCSLVCVWMSLVLWGGPGLCVVCLQCLCVGADPMDC